MQTLFSMKMWKKRGVIEHYILDWPIIDIHIIYDL